jgi:ketosteroid isomerase-like protein
MSQGNVEIAHSVVEAFNRSDLEGVFRYAAPDFVFDNSRALGEWRGVHSGPDQFKRQWETFTGSWESIRFEIVEVLDAGDRLFTQTTAKLTGRDGIEVATRTDWVWTFSGDKVTRVVLFTDRAEALEAAGLSE